MVQAVPLEADHVLFGDVEIVLSAELGDLVDDLERVLLALQLLDVVPLADQIPVRRGARRGASGSRRPSSGDRPSSSRGTDRARG